MSEILHLTGMPQAIPNGAAKEIRFVLSADDDQQIICVASYGIAAQIASGLGRALQILRMALIAHGAIEPIAPERIQDIHIERDQLSGAIVVELTTAEMAIPYAFQIPVQNAVELADRLKNEAAKPSQTGHA